jgi:hypothetical protein
MEADRERLIRERAFTLWQEEGCPEGRQVVHWLRAEAETGKKTDWSVANDGKKVKARRISGRQKR